MWIYKKGHLLRLWHSKWKIVIMEMFWSHVFLYGLCFNRRSKICLINFFQILQHFMVEWLNIHGILSLFHISKHDLALGLKTQNIPMYFMVLVVLPQPWLYPAKGSWICQEKKWTFGKLKLLFIWRKPLGVAIPWFIFSTLDATYVNNFA
jgi:hypothetical protein